MAESEQSSSDALNYRYDVVIAGGGMVGASLALLLAHHSGEQINVLVVESFPLPSSPSSLSKTKTNYSPSFDARSTALSYGSRLILEPLGLWPALAAHIAEINHIHVSDKGRPGSATMHGEDQDWPSLGYVVENAWFGNVLLSALREKKNIHFCSPASVKNISSRQDGVELLIESSGASKTVVAQLAVVADGANSSLRQQLGIDVEVNDYQQTALIANVSFRQAHQGWAFERFTDQGPMALLPLTDSEQGEPRAALVWSLAKDQALYLKDCPDQQFLKQLQDCFGHRLGEFIRVGDRFTYPLKLFEAQEQVRSSIVLMGNAAHSLHPVAGQGFNLALRDCARLASLLVEAASQQKNIGALSLLQDYHQQQQLDQQKTIIFSDRLPALFSSKNWAVSMVRGLGLSALDILPTAKSQFVRHGAGMNNTAEQG